MLKKDAVITVYGLQEDEEGIGEPITVVTPGHFYRKNGMYYVIYDESELTGLVDTKTMIKASPEAVSVTRSGKYPSQLTFENGKRHLSLYHTEYGDLAIAVTTQRIVVDMTDDGGMVDVEYSVEIDNQPVGSNHLKVEVKVSAVAEKEGV